MGHKADRDNSASIPGKPVYILKEMHKALMGRKKQVSQLDGWARLIQTVQSKHSVISLSPYRQYNLDLEWII